MKQLLCMRTNGGVPGSVQVAKHQRDRFLGFVLDRVDNDLEIAVLGRQFGLGGAVISFSLTRRWAINCSMLMIFRSCFLAIIASVSRDARSPGIVQDFAQRAGRLQPGHSRQIDRRFGVSGATKHATLFGQQRIDVTGSNKVVEPAIGGQPSE